MKPRVQMLIHQFRPVASGAELQAERLATKLVALGHDVRVLTNLLVPHTQPRERLSGISIRRCEFPMAYRVDSECGETLRYLVQHRHEYDILHSHMAYGHAVVAALVAEWFGKRSLFKIACAGPMGDLQGFSRMAGARAGLAILKRVDAIIAISQEVRDELLQWGFPADRIHLIPNGVDTTQFHPTPPLSDRRVVQFLLVGRRTPQKGIDTTLEAVAELLRRGFAGRFRVRLLGWDYPEYDYREMAQCLGVVADVEFCPFEQAIEEVYRAAHCLILPSRGEGLSNVLLEAMACGLPVIASRVSGTVDVLCDETRGILIDSGSPRALADAMAVIIEQPDRAAQFGEAGRRRVLDAFSLNSVAERYQQLYTELLA